MHRFTDVHGLLDIGRQGTLLGLRESEEALEILVSGFLKPDKLPTEQILQGRYDAYTQNIKTLVNNYMDDVIGIQKQAKRLRTEVSKHCYASHSC